MENKVVKCINHYCGQYFMHTEKALKCPFCRTEYKEVEEKAKDLPTGRQVKKEAVKTQKKSFKLWNGNYKK